MSLTSNQWYVVYTQSKHEKKIHSLLEERNIPSFLPLYKEIRQWSDRKKTIISPLFPNYLFVNPDPKSFWKILDMQGVVNYITFNNRPASISADVIDSIKVMLKGSVEVQTSSFMKGEQVVVIDGPLTGLKGEFIRYGKKNLIVLQIELIKRSIQAEIEPHQVQKLGKAA